jgi:hypothetical protein
MYHSNEELTVDGERESSATLGEMGMSAQP